MAADIGHAIEPLLPLPIEIGIVQEAPALYEIAPQIPHGPLDLALGLRKVGATGPGVKPQ